LQLLSAYIAVITELLQVNPSAEPFSVKWLNDFNTIPADEEALPELAHSAVKIVQLQRTIFTYLIGSAFTSSYRTL